jgi:lysophospholipase L1-like esterase
MRARLLALLATATLFLLGAVPAQADSGGNGDDSNRDDGQSYLALGDSVPFGFSPLKNTADADNFVGYPEIVAQQLDLKDVNATCPGEATGGFLSLTGTDNVCRPYRASAPLHVHYKTSQMDYAIKYLSSHKHSTSLITLTLGANDVFHLQNVCTALHKGDPNPVAAITKCVNDGIPAVLTTMFANLNTIFSKLRATGYKGLIVAVTYYSLDYADTSGAVLLNTPMVGAATANGALIASGLEAWRATATASPANGSSCVAGLLIRTSPTACDVHPTPLGRDLLANAVVQTIAASCPAHDAEECLRAEGD